MKERPILFSGPMVRAILAGRKTQTRRVIGLTQFGPSETPGYDWTFRGTRRGGRDNIWQDFRNDKMMQLCKFGQPGDRLWVRETFSDSEPVFYRADGFLKDEDVRWNPSIFMPRELCRLTLEIVAVRVERLQNISANDALAEGIREWQGQDGPPNYYGITLADVWETNPIAAFARVWDEINASRMVGWNVNPWVWVVEFRRVTP